MLKAHMRSCEALETCYNNSHIDGWSENHITTNVLESLESIGLVIDWSDKPQKVKWEGFKLRGHSEYEYGDIAVVVRVWITSDRYIDGVAFYEAKRQFFRDDSRPIGFSSLKTEQLSRIHSHTHSSSVLLYDVDIEQGRALSTSVTMPFVRELAAAKLADSSGRVLHSYGEPWVVSLANNFLGLNLDYREEAIDEIKHSTESYRKPNFILNAAVALSDLVEPAIDNSFINNNDYEHWLKEGERKPKTSNTKKYDGPSF